MECTYHYVVTWLSIINSFVRFLLAQLHLDRLTDCISKKDVAKTLEGFRTGSDAYDDAYNAAMNRINQQTPRRSKLAISVLSWITHARRPLSVAELQHALGVEVGEADFDEDNVPLVEKIVSTTVGLVAIDHESDIIRLVHYTTQEFFERTKRIWLPKAENYVAEVCTSYLSCSAFKSGWCHNLEDLERRIRSFQFYPYTVRNWHHHVNVSDFSPSHATFLAKTTNFHAFIQAFQFLDVKPVQDRLTRNVNPSGITGLHVAAESGWTEIVKMLLKDYDNIDLYDHCNRTPFFLAAKSGHLTVMETLLSHGDIDVNVMARPSGYTPLICLARRGHTAAVKMLLDTGKTNIVSKCGRQKTALYYAAVGGHVDVVRLLLDAQGSDEEMIREAHSSALLGAIVMQQEIIMKMLLKEGHVDINVQTTDSQGPFFWDNGAGHKYLDTVIWKQPYREMESKAFKKPKVLKNPKAYAGLDFSNPNIFSWLRRDWHRKTNDKSGKYGPNSLNEGKSPLILAVHLGHENLVKLLLDKMETDADLEAKDSHARTALSMAVQLGRVNIFRLLLNSGRFDLNSRDSNGDTPLMIAASQGDEGIVELLLKTATVTVDGRNNEGKTALLLAVGRFEDSTSVVKLLLDTGIAGVSIKDHQGLTPLHMAVKRGHEKIVRLLFDTPDIDFDLEDTHGRKLLSIAVHRRQMSIVKLCLDTGRFDINANDHSGLTPLMLATEHFSSRITSSRSSSRSDIFRLLLDTGNIDFDAKDHKYERTALLWAAHAGHLEGLRTLLVMGKFDVNASDLYGFTCFTLAAYKGRKDVVKYLLNTEGVDLYAKDYAVQRTALMWASYADEFEVVELLLESGRFDINVVDSDGRSPIAIASQERNHKTVAILKSYKDNSNEKDQNQTHERPLVDSEMSESYKRKNNIFPVPLFISNRVTRHDVTTGDYSFNTSLNENYSSDEEHYPHTSSDEECSVCTSFYEGEGYSSYGGYSSNEEHSSNEDYSASEVYNASGTDEF